MRSNFEEGFATSDRTPDGRLFSLYSRSRNPHLGSCLPEDEVLPRLYRLHETNPNVKVSVSASMMALHGDVRHRPRQSSPRSD